MRYLATVSQHMFTALKDVANDILSSTRSELSHIMHATQSNCWSATTAFSKIILWLFLSSELH